jgi:hypothetical protein
VRPVKNTWPETEASRGVMFFAQLMREMLATYSFESFRVHSLDTLARLDEALVVIADVSAQRLPLAALEPILQELIWSLQKDPVAQTIASEVVTEISDKFKAGAKRDIRDLRAGVELLRKRLLPEYRNSLEHKIVELFDKIDARVKLRSTVAAYCSYLINRGYSKLYLANLIEKTYFSGEMKRTGAPSLTRLFLHLNGKDKRYDVYVSLGRVFGKYLERISESDVFELHDIPEEVADTFQLEDNFDKTDLYFKRCVSSKDPFSAEGLIEAYLTSLRSITYLARRGIRFHWSKEKYVRRTRAPNDGGLFFGTELKFQQNVVPTGRSIKSLHSQSMQILTSFNPASTERIISSINTSALARSSSNLENQLISLWSAVEVLLSDPPAATARINHYVDLLVPCVCAKYVRRYIIAINDEMRIGYRSRMAAILSELPSELGIDEYTRFTFLMFDEQFKDTRKKLFDMCESNPLALHRLWKLNKDFGSPKNMMASLEHHQARVGWQLHRIYRARNQLVHAGKIPSYLQSLVLNAFEYYRSAMGTILSVASKEEGPSDIDQVVSEVCIDYAMYRRAVTAMKEPTFDSSVFSRVFR